MNHIIVIGAGPAGIGCVQGLLRENFPGYITLVDKGRPMSLRPCPVDHGNVCKGCNGICNVLSGFGGAMHYGDSVKLSCFPSGKRLAAHLGSKAMYWMDRACDVFKHALEEEVKFIVPGEYSTTANDSDSFRSYPIATLSAPQLKRALNSWYREYQTLHERISLKLRSNVLAIEKLPSDRFQIEIKEKNGDTQTLIADAVAICTGRGGLHWWRSELRKLNVRFTRPTPSVGLRFETRAEWLEDAGRIHPDYKISRRLGARKTKSFCFCAGTGGGRIK